MHIEHSKFTDGTCECVNAALIYGSIVFQCRC